MAPSDAEEEPALVLLAADQRQPLDDDEPRCVVRLVCMLCVDVLVPSSFRLFFSLRRVLCVFAQVCGRYGAYICDATDEDVCSIECRDVCVLRHSEALLLSEEQAKQRALAATLLRRRLGIRVVSGDVVIATDSSAQQSRQSIPFPIVDFADCGLPPQLYVNMQTKLLEKPSPVQMQVIPCILDGSNVRVSVALCCVVTWYSVTRLTAGTRCL